MPPPPYDDDDHDHEFDIDDNDTDNDNDADSNLDDMDLDDASADRDTDAGLGDADTDSLPATPSPAPAHQLDTIDRLLQETTPDYDTWVDRNKRRSLSTLRGRSEWTLGADELNESLRPNFLQRHRHVLAPDEAFGAVFMWDCVVANSRDLERRAWAAVAEERAWAPPDMDDIVRAEDMAAEAAVSRVFFWTQDWGEVKRCVFRKHELYEQLRGDFQYRAVNGLRAWLAALSRYGVRCILCAARPRERMEDVVRLLGLDEFFTRSDIVSSDDEFENVEQMMLVAAVKAERPPGKCVVFTDRPAGITAGHEVSAKVVALIGAHPAYEVKTADEIVRDFEGLVVYNIRRLFSEEGMELMDPQTQLQLELEQEQERI